MMMILGKGVLKKRNKVTEELCNFIKIAIWHGCSPVNLLLSCKFQNNLLICNNKRSIILRNYLLRLNISVYTTEIFERLLLS